MNTASALISIFFVCALMYVCYNAGYALGAIETHLKIRIVEQVILDTCREAIESR